MACKGEAHITVISPPEYQILASANVTIDDINDLATKYKIQQSTFQVVCLGRVELQTNVVYQLVVRSPDLVRLRTRLFQLYWHNGGNTALFDPEVKWPLYELYLWLLWKMNNNLGNCRAFGHISP